MTLNILHFDTKLQAPTDIKDVVKNSLAEYLFPDTKFAAGNIYENSTTPKELEKYEDMTPQFSNGKKVYFGSHEVERKSIQIGVMEPLTVPLFSHPVKTSKNS
jgi:hypothetical protein